MSVKTSRIDMKDVYLYVYSSESGVSSVPIAFKFSEGNFTFTVKKEKEFILNRGQVRSGSVRNANETPMAIKFEGEFSTLFGKDSTPDSAYEFLMGEGDCEDWRGMGPDACEPYATYLVLVDDPTVKRAGCGEGEILLFRDFFCDTADVDVNAGTMSFDGRCKRIAPEKLAWPNPGTLWDSSETYHVTAAGVDLQMAITIPSTSERLAEIS